MSIAVRSQVQIHISWIDIDLAWRNEPWCHTSVTPRHWWCWDKCSQHIQRSASMDPAMLRTNLRRTKTTWTGAPTQVPALSEWGCLFLCRLNKHWSGFMFPPQTSFCPLEALDGVTVLFFLWLWLPKVLVDSRRLLQLRLYLDQQCLRLQLNLSTRKMR